VSATIGELPPAVLERLSWWQRQRYLRRLNGDRPTDTTATPTSFTLDEMRSANRAYDRWYRGKGPAIDEHEMAAYRAYKRRVRDNRRRP
jgi:hypothetical protein